LMSFSSLFLVMNIAVPSPRRVLRESESN
jgi:hypothetical protein